MNDPNLITKLEIVLKGDGTVDKVTVIKTSGYTPFDVAAIDTVYSAAPYADPPREIRSGNGKIYVHWTFHRDDRQCATSGVDYFILDNANDNRDKGESDDKPGMTRGLPTPQVKPQNGLKRLQRDYNDTPAHRAKMRQLDDAAGGADPEPDPAAAQRAAQQVVHGDDPAARAVAEDWLAALARGDVKRMLSHAAFPFRSTSGVAAKNANELRALLEGLAEESSNARHVRALQVYSPAGVRGVLGSLPPGFDEGGMLFAVADIGGEGFVAVLAPRNGGWRVVGLVRR
jgi:TonB family protein